MDEIDSPNSMRRILEFGIGIDKYPDISILFSFFDAVFDF